MKSNGHGAKNAPITQPKNMNSKIPLVLANGNVGCIVKNFIGSFSPQLGVTVVFCKLYIATLLLEVVVAIFAPLHLIDAVSCGLFSTQDLSICYIYIVIQFYENFYNITFLLRMAPYTRHPN
jgi:hypothetical protein